VDDRAKGWHAWPELAWTFSMITKLENRSLDRGLAILEVLTQHAPCSLQQLHDLCGLPKSTIRRLLGTLGKRHFIRQGISDGLYRTNVSLPWADDREFAATAARLVEVAKPHMLRLTETVKWPCNIGIPRAGRWHLLDSSRSMSPFDMDRQKVLEWERNIFITATGLAYLAELDFSDMRKVVAETEGDAKWGLERVKIDQEMLRQELIEIKKRGYAVRRHGFKSRPESEIYNAIAVAIHERRRPIGSICLWWPRKHLSAERFARMFLGPLQSTAKAISLDLTKVP
jgi:IclR family mhp operon transcriptional activator